jgi:hypothetical protein
MREGPPVLNPIFPKRIDNTYHGHQLAVWILTLFLLVKTFASITQIGLNPLWTSREILQGVEGVPLDTYTTSAADAAIVLFGWWGIAGLMPTLLGFVAVLRYRAMIPIIYLLMAITKISEMALAEISPIVGILGAGAPMPLIGVALLLVGFGLSVTTPRRSKGAGMSG